MKKLYFLVVIIGILASGCTSINSSNGVIMPNNNNITIKDKVEKEKFGLKTAGNYIPGHAFTDPAKAISVIHPDQIEENKVEKICTFIGVMDPALFTEVIIVGGVWPTIALDNDNGKMHKGYCYLENVNYFGDFILRFVFFASKKELESTKILYFNRDGGICYSITGKEVKYNVKKFDKKEEYRKELFNSKGISLEEMSSFWAQYIREHGMNGKINYFSEVSVNGKNWEQFKKVLTFRMRENYKMGNGEKRCGYLPLNQFKYIASSNPGFTGVDRYIKHAKLPLLTLPFTGTGMLVSAGASVVSDAILANVNNSWDGFYARSQTIRYDMANIFRYVCKIYQNLLIQRDEKIISLENQLQEANK